MPEETKPEIVDAASDARVVNNTMRHTYRVLSDEEKAAVTWIKDTAAALSKYCDEIGSSRELSLAKTKIEEAVFWAVKHVTA